MCTCCPSSRYRSQSTSVEYLSISALSLAEYLYWQCHFAYSTCSNFVSHSFFVYGHSLVEASTLIMKSALMIIIKEFLVCHISLNTAPMLFWNYNLTGKWHMYIQLCSWWIKCWRFCPKIANHQSLLLTNISSYMVSCYNVQETKIFMDSQYPQNIFK